MRVTTYGPNLPFVGSATFHVHLAGCAHGKRGEYKGAEQDTRDFESRRSIVLDAYPPRDFRYDPETEYSTYRDDFYFAPCVQDLPEE